MLGKSVCWIWHSWNVPKMHELRFPLRNMSRCHLMQFLYHWLHSGWHDYDMQSQSDVLHEWSQSRPLQQRNDRVRRMLGFHDLHSLRPNVLLFVRLMHTMLDSSSELHQVLSDWMFGMPGFNGIDQRNALLSNSSACFHSINTKRCTCALHWPFLCLMQLSECLSMHDLQFKSLHSDQRIM